SNDETEQILALVDNHMRFGHVFRMKESTLKKFMRMPKFEEHLELHRLDVMAGPRLLGAYDFFRGKIYSTPPEILRPQPLITGDDLIGAGYRPGPLFREALAAVEDAQLEGLLASREEALVLVQRQFPLDKA